MTDSERLGARGSHANAVTSQRENGHDHMAVSSSFVGPPPICCREVAGQSRGRVEQNPSYSLSTLLRINVDLASLDADENSMSP